jgi:hypothetical protein
MRSGTEKNPNPCDAPIKGFLRTIARPFSAETAKHYRLRKDGAIIRATPKPPTRKPKLAKVYGDPVVPRRPAAEAMHGAAGREDAYRKQIAAAMRALGREKQVRYQKSDLTTVCWATGLPLSVVRDFAPRLFSPSPGE